MNSLLRAAKTVVLLAFICSIARPYASGADKISAADLPKHAIEQSQVTVTGTPPFHLRAKITEATNPDNDGYKAEIDEYWAAPDKWKRTVETGDFSQTLIVNGGKTSEQITGDYYPNWLRTLVTAIFDPAPALEGVDMSQSSDNPMIGGSLFCRRFAFRAGIPPIGNNVFSTFCFDGSLLESVGKPGYTAAYKNYKKFAGKQVARKIREYIEPGTELEASIVELSELHNADEASFAVEKPATPLETLRVTEAVLRGLVVGTPVVQWPTIHGGKPVGVLSIYVCIDRGGKVREIYSLNSDHPEMSDAARMQVMKWQLKPAVNRNGTHVQLESILTFAYETKIAP
jgi:hypothetical protein